MKYDVIIGIEIHCELKTKSKMFAAAPLGFGQEPNTLINDVVLGYPGSMPTINKQGIVLAIIACKLLNMKIDSLLKFDRKHYFYKDLPKGYQITQQFNPIGKNGFVYLNNHKINIERLQIEEDTAKVINKVDGYYLDFNRCGNPLIEIISAPEIKNSKEAIKYLELIRNMMIFSEISDAKMEESSLRCDINISLKEKTNSVFGTKVEIKNLNSLNNVEKAIDYEIKRQTTLLDNLGEIVLETRRWDEKKLVTIAMRSKMSFADYKFIPETNLAPVQLSPKFINNIIDNMGDSFYELKQKLSNLQFNELEIQKILSNKNLISFIKFGVNMDKYYSRFFKLLTNDLKEIIINNKLKKINITPKALQEIVISIEEDNMSQKIYKQILKIIAIKGFSVEDALKSIDIFEITDEKNIQTIIEQIIITNSEIMHNITTRPERVFKFIMGQIMKKTKGKVNSNVATKLVKKRLSIV